MGGEGREIGDPQHFIHLYVVTVVVIYLWSFDIVSSVVPHTYTLM